MQRIRGPRRRRGALRRSAAAVAVGALALGGGIAAAQVFPDVAEGSFYEDAVQWAADNGITQGVGDTGEFRPEAPTSRGEMVVFLQRLDALIAERQLATGPIEVVHPPAVAFAHHDDASAIAVRHSGAQVEVEGEGRVLVPLTGPSALGGRNFVFSSAEVCITDVDGAVVDSLVVLQSPDGGAVVPQEVELRADGCISYAGAGSGWVSGQAATLELTVGTGGVFRIDSITSSWVPS